jgi:hypothetical protein
MGCPPQTTSETLSRNRPPLRKLVTRTSQSPRPHARGKCSTGRSLDCGGLVAPGAILSFPGTIHAAKATENVGLQEKFCPPRTSQTNANAPDLHGRRPVLPFPHGSHLEDSVALSASSVPARFRPVPRCGTRGGGRRTHARHRRPEPAGPEAVGLQGRHSASYLARIVHAFFAGREAAHGGSTGS